MAKAATIRDVARQSGTAISTVSRVINGNYPVSAETRQRVLEAIAALDYRPDGVARSLKVKNTYLVGVVVADLCNSFFMRLVKGMEHVLSGDGYSIIIAEHEENPERERRIVEMLLDKKVSAIVTTTCHTSATYYRGVRTGEVPIVFVDRTVPELEADAVMEDNEANAYELTRYLLENGHRRIAVITGGAPVYTTASRYAGYCRALREYDIEPAEQYVVAEQQGSSHEGILALFHHLPRAEWPTAVFASNNRRAEDALRAFRDLGLRVPEDVSLVSYGNISLPWLFNLKLTRIEQDMVRIGQKTGELVLRKIKYPQSGYREYVMNSQIVYGNSVRDLTRLPRERR